MGDEEDGCGAVSEGTKATALAGTATVAVVAAFLYLTWTHSGPIITPVVSPSAASVEMEHTRQKWGAEADALDMILRERQEPQDGITCYRRAGRYECPLHLAGQPPRWAACRLRRDDERGDDGGRCAWIVR